MQGTSKSRAKDGDAAHDFAFYMEYMEYTVFDITAVVWVGVNTTKNY